MKAAQVAEANKKRRRRKRRRIRETALIRSGIRYRKKWVEKIKLALWPPHQKDRANAGYPDR